MRLGKGFGAAAAVACHNGMATFGEAGLASVGIALDLYSHVSPGVLEDAGRRLTPRSGPL
jgi:hypothetical protein